MFLETHWTPEPRQPEPPRRRISKRGETVLLALIGFNLLMLLIAPIGGSTVIDILVWLFTKAR